MSKGSSYPSETPEVICSTQGPKRNVKDGVRCVRLSRKHERRLPMETVVTTRDVELNTQMSEEKPDRLAEFCREWLARNEAALRCGAAESGAAKDHALGVKG